MDSVGRGTKRACGVRISSPSSYTETISEQAISTSEVSSGSRGPYIITELLSSTQSNTVLVLSIGDVKSSCLLPRGERNKSNADKIDWRLGSIVRLAALGERNPNSFHSFTTPVGDMGGDPGNSISAGKTGDLGRMGDVKGDGKGGRVGIMAWIFCAIVAGTVATSSSKPSFVSLADADGEGSTDIALGEDP